MMSCCKQTTDAKYIDILREYLNRECLWQFSNGSLMYSRYTYKAHPSVQQQVYGLKSKQKGKKVLLPDSDKIYRVHERIYNIYLY